MSSPVFDTPDQTTYDVFEGPEKTLTISFRNKKIEAGSLRFIPLESWKAVLKHARCEILSGIESCPAIRRPKKGLDAEVLTLGEQDAGSSIEQSSHSKQCEIGKSKHVCSKRTSTKGLTGYLLSESSLFVSDSSLTLKTCGRTTPLEALEPILDMVVPKWKAKHPEQYLKYVSFTRLGYMFPEDQLSPHTSWADEVAYLENHFMGEAVVLGSQKTSTSHVYVANYLPKDEISDVFSTQVSLTNLDPLDSMKRFVGSRADDQAPLQTAWQQLHGDDPRSVAARKQLDECFFEPIGYSANGVFGRHFTTIHATPQSNCSYVSVETSLPLDREARPRFATGATQLAGSGSSTLTMTEFALTPTLFSGTHAPEILGFEVKQTSQTVAGTFACAHHHYVRKGMQVTSTLPVMLSPSLACTSAPSTPGSSPGCCDVEAEVSALSLDPLFEADETPVFAVDEIGDAAIRCAEHTLGAIAGTSMDSVDDVTTALIDLAALRRRADLWRSQLPRVEPFYAVKCNPHPDIVRTLRDLWQEYGVGGFDCASPAEMEVVAATGIDLGQHVVYANPCKQGSAITFAKSAGVRWIVFDNEAELQKIKGLYPKAQLVLRIQTDDSAAQCPMSNKFGACLADVEPLLAAAKAAAMAVVGVSFHVGSGCSEHGPFKNALERARAAFDVAERLGFQPSLLDIGGGFPGWDEEGHACFADHAADIRAGLAELFPSPNIRVIAEPGRFFAAMSQSILTTVISVCDTVSGSRYYLNDGLYGSFNCLLYDHAVLPTPVILRGGKELADAGPSSSCTLFGPTCDGFDVLAEGTSMPKLQVGDRLLFRDMGAYTSAASTSFNGFAPARSFLYKSGVRA